LIVVPGLFSAAPRRSLQSSLQFAETGSAATHPQQEKKKLG
jgi:hypothetical protein